MKVKFIPNSPFAFSYGGFEIQTKATLNAVQSVGVDASFIDFYSEDNDFEVAHIWSATPGSSKLAELAKKAGKKVVVTALLSYFESRNEQIRYFISDLIRKYEYLKKFNKTADAFVVMNELQKEVAIKYCRISDEKVEIIPNTIDSNFYKISEYNKDSFVLCSGNVCQRKNQLNLVKACLLADKPLVLLGTVLDGEAAYGQQIDELVATNSSIKWVKGLNHASDQMIQLYSQASVIALPSFVEQQPLCLLEGAAMNKPILTSNKAFGKQPLYQNAKLVDPNSVASIAAGIHSVFETPEKFIVPKSIINTCKKDSIGNAYKELYQRIIA
ncbi:MAG: glycosyltransferase family 4 protein [Cytophagales bacterium]